MTVAATPTITGPFVGTGGSATLQFTFKCFAATDILVQRDGTTLAYGGDYTVTLNADQDNSPGGSVAITAAANTLSAHVYVGSNISYAQPVHLPSQASWSPTIVEKALDRLTLLIRQLADVGYSAIVAPFGETLGLLPAKASRPGMYLAFDANGDPAVASGTGNDSALRTDLAASTGATLAGYAPSWSGAITRTVQDKLRDLPHLYDIILPANRNTSYDATAALNAALATGERFVLPKAEVRFSGQLLAAVANGGFEGQGVASVLKHTSATGDMFQLGDGSNEIRGLLFRNFRLWSTIAKTAGYAFNGRFISYARFENISCGSIADFSDSGSAHMLYKGYCFNGFAQCAVEGGEVVTANDCVTANGKTGQTWGYELSFGGGMRLYGSNNRGFYLGGSAGGVHLNRLDVSKCLIGVDCDNAISGETNREIFINPGCSIDSCNSWGMRVRATGLQILKAPGGWIAGCGVTVDNTGGLLIEALAATRAQLPGLEIYANYGPGADLGDGDMNLSGADVYSNGRRTGGAHGVIVRAGVDHFQCSAATLRGNGNGTLGRAIYVEAGVPSFSIVNNADAANGEAPSLEFAGGLTLSATKKVSGNSGFATEGKGQSTITAGQTTVTVTHGLDFAPNYPQVVGIGHSVHGWVQNLNTTTFQIVIASVQGADIAFQWSF